MFTQCEHCKAIFRINMREVTVAKGQLRCGECHSVFSATAALSTNKPKPFKAIEIEYKHTKENLSANDKRAILTMDDWQSTPPHATINKTKENNTHRVLKSIEQDNNKITNITNKWLIVTALSLTALLAFQVLYNYRHIFAGGNRYQPDKIQMLNHNVFAHPIESGVLLISASIENTAEYDQPFPILEVRLTNSQSKLVALRRFSPAEYLDNHSKGMLLRKNQATSLKLKIKDPGNQATRFQFDFL